MNRNEGKKKTERRALRDVSNHKSDNPVCGGDGKLSKSLNHKTNSVLPKQFHKQLQQSQRKFISVTKNRYNEEEEEEGGCLDRLLVIRSDLASLTCQIDELVAQWFKMKSISKQGKREIESFSHVFSDMLSSLEPWVPRLQKALSSTCESENQLGTHFLADNTTCAMNEDEKFEVQSPEQTRRISLVSPSPLVSWRPDCNADRGRQLFLLTPLPISKTLSSKRSNLSQSMFEGLITSNHPVGQLPSFPTFCEEDAKEDLLKCIEAKRIPDKPCDLVGAEANMTVGVQSVSSPVVSKRDQSVLVMPPCLKMSPPKSCALLEPFSESAHKGKSMVRKGTPFPVGKLSQISESPSDSEGSEDLALKYPELLAIQRGCKSQTAKKEIDASPSWIFSPPKTCVLLKPTDDKSLDTVAVDHTLPVAADSNQIQKPLNQEPPGNSLMPLESTPAWKNPQSTMRRGKQPGENTLKKELWTKFEAASTYGIRLNVSALQRTAQKGFLDMLDEVSCDGESSVPDSLR